MDWIELQSKYSAPEGQPDRCARLLALGRVLDGTQYDVLPHPFSRERSGAGEYIPLSKRRPSVRTNLCRTVVDESVSLLFGDTHWPTVVAQTDGVAQVLTDFARDTGLPQIMAHAATRGSVGSAAVLFEVVDRAPRLTVLETAYLTPRWNAAGYLERVAEKYQVVGRDLAALGYAVPADMRSVRYWWQRIWTVQACEVMVPQPATDQKPPRLDEERSIRHGLGFVPIVWIRNLCSVAPNDPDGECTFLRAIDTVIEADYLLSQGGRALKYTSDPVLVLKTGAAEGDAHTGGSSTALTLPPEGDAKLLEINGNSSGAVLEQYRELRALVLEQLHGNRAHADKIAAAQSGRAMEMMCQSLIWLADRLRQSYGDGGLIPILKMACAFSNAVDGGIRIGDKMVSGLSPDGLDLHWPSWFPPTPPELLQLAQGLVTAVDGNILSAETAVAIFGARAGVSDPAQEWTRVTAQIADAAAKAAQTAGIAAATGTRKDAMSGHTLAHEVEA